VMTAVAPPLPPPSPAQCAGLMTLLADDARRREGMSKTATGLTRLASLLENRARTELGATGKSGAEIDRALTLAREAIDAQPGTAPDIEACMELARP
jgi:hypothetical protein